MHGRVRFALIAWIGQEVPMVRRGIASAHVQVGRIGKEGEGERRREGENMYIE